MTKEKDEALKIENQLCFPLYAASKEIIRAYTPYLSRFDLTYTQYISLLALWEYGKMNVKQLGECLHLDSGTLTPLLKKLEEKGYIRRFRDREDERVVHVSVTEEGKKLKEKVSEVPYQIGSCLKLDKEDAKQLYLLLYKVLNHLEAK